MFLDGFRLKKSGKFEAISGSASGETETETCSQCDLCPTDEDGLLSEGLSHVTETR